MILTATEVNIYKIEEFTIYQFFPVFPAVINNLKNKKDRFSAVFL